MKMICGDLNVNVPQRCMCVSTCSSAGDAIWVCLESAAFVEEICHWGQTDFEVSKQQFPVHALCFMLVGQHVIAAPGTISTCCQASVQ